MTFANRTSKTLLVAVLLLLSAATLPGTASSLGASGDARETVPVPVNFAQENNSTVRHEDPESVNQEGDMANVEGWLAAQLSERLEQSSIQLSQGQYDAAQDLVGEEFREQYQQYVDVAGETGGDSNERVEQFETARETQREYIDSVQEYRETYDEYREARENGNQTRARTLARELERLSRSIDRQGETLSRSYENISEGTGANVSESQQTVRNTSRNVTDQQSQVRAETFVRTTLVATTNATNVSFTDPLVVRGRLAAENGSAVSNRTVSFTIRNQTLRTSTNATGNYTLTYRPTTLPTNATSTTLRYVPVNESVFLGSSANLSVNVTQVTPTVRITDRPAEVAYNQTVRVRGSVAVNGAGAQAVPVTISLGGERLATNRTDVNGTFTATLTVPETIPAGTADLRVSLPLRNRALAPTNATADLIVHETETNLTLSGTPSGSSAVRFSGQLLSASGVPVANQSVTVSAGETTLAVARTDENGTYETTVDIPERLRGDETATVPIVARFDGNGTNLESAREMTRLTIPAVGESQSGLLDALNSFPMWAVPVAAFGIGALALFARRRFSGFGGRSGTDTDEPATDPSAADRRTTSASPSGLSPSLLSLARTQLSDGKPDDAVRTAYAAVRRQLVSRFDSGAAYTHWELYHACQTDGFSSEQLDALLELTQAYERAVFDSEHVSSDAAAAAFEAVSAFETGETNA